MRICVIVPNHQAARFGGAQYQVSLLVDELARHPNVEIFSLVKRAPSASYRGPDTVVKFGFVSKALSFGTFVLDLPGLWLALSRLRPDVIYQRVGCSLTGAALAYARRHGVRLVWHVARDDDTMPTETVRKTFNPLKIVENVLYDYGKKHSAEVIVQHGAQARNLFTHYGHKTIKKIPNGHPLPPYRAREVSEGPIVLWLANLKPTKQPELFVRAVASLESRYGIKFVMIGRPYRLRAPQKKFEEEVNAAQGVQYLGELSHDEAAAWLDKAYLLVNTSRIEGLSNTFIEAWLRGVPVVSLNSNPDFLLSGPKPLGVCANGNFHALVRAIDFLLGDRKAHAAMRSNCRQIAEEKFSDRNIRDLAAYLLEAN